MTRSNAFDSVDAPMLSSTICTSQESFPAQGCEAPRRALAAARHVTLFAAPSDDKVACGHSSFGFCSAASGQFLGRGNFCTPHVRLIGGLPSCAHELITTKRIRRPSSTFGVISPCPARFIRTMCLVQPGRPRTERGFTETSLRYPLRRTSLAYTIGLEKPMSGLNCCLEKTHMAPIEHCAVQRPEDRVLAGESELLPTVLRIPPH